MRRPDEAECFYLDFDGFFAGVMQLAFAHLRGRPVGVVPFAGAEDRGILIACSREAKLAGVGNIMPVADARRLCPDIHLVPQEPDLYRRAHNALICEISTIVPIDAIKSIDEMTGAVEPKHRADPLDLAARVKGRLLNEFGPWITCSMGFAANRLLAKMACKAGKRPEPGRYGDGALHWPPSIMPGPLLSIPLSDVPGVGSRMAERLARAEVRHMTDLLSLAPKQARGLWRSVTGERLWYALNGYVVQAQPSRRGMFGHGRVLPPDSRHARHAREASRLLIVKAARRMRREAYNASRVWLLLSMRGRDWQGFAWMPASHDDQAVLSALSQIWGCAWPEISREAIMRIHVALLDLSPASARQLDWIADDDRQRQKWEAATRAIDGLNRRYGRTIISVGPWASPTNAFVGGKISYTRIPRAEDFR